MRKNNNEFINETTVRLVLLSKGDHINFRQLAQDCYNYPDREEDCFTMMEKGPAYGEWSNFCYKPVAQRFALGECVQPTDVIVGLSQCVAGFSVEKVMIAFAVMYYSEILYASNMTQRRRIEILNGVLNMDEEIKKLPSCLIDAMNKTFFTNN